MAPWKDSQPFSASSLFLFYDFKLSLEIGISCESVERQPMHLLKLYEII